MAIVTVLFWLLLGFHFLSIQVTAYHQIIIGILALIIGLEQLLLLIRRGGI